MTDSLTPRQRDEVQQLGRWRDEGHRLAVGRDGKVSIHPADTGENYVATEQREGAARRQGPSGWQGASGQSGAAAPPESACEDGIADVRQQYLAAIPEIREYYPDLRVIEVEDGVWVVTQIFPIGRDGPSFSICLFLHDDKTMDAKAFAFEGNGLRARAPGLRHTNFPDASICAFCADDGVWAPGRNPLDLLGLYAEWLVCQLFLQTEGVWPGRQYGPDASYRVQEFHADEWCFCGSELRYGRCHADEDRREVVRLKELGLYEPLGERAVPREVIAFAKSAWRIAPAGSNLFPHKFQTPVQASEEMRHYNSRGAAILINASIKPNPTRPISMKSRLLSGSR